MRLSLTILKGRDIGKVRRFELQVGSQVIIGRHEDCDMPLWDEASSRRHAAIELVSNCLQIVDLGSSNGTTVNGRSAERVQLFGGEQIRIGETEFRVDTEGFQRRETVVLSRSDYTVEASLSPEELDLGSHISSNQIGSKKLNALLDFVKALQAVESGEEIFDALLNTSNKVIHATDCAVIPCSAKGRDPHWNEALQRSKAGKKSKVQGSKLSKSIIERVLSEGKALKISDTQTDPTTRGRESIVSRGVSSILAAPIIARGRVHGAIYLESESQQKNYEEHDLAFVATLAQVAGLALESAEKLQHSKQLLKTQEQHAPSKLLTECEELKTSLTHLARFAASGGPVLITGETGTGKELLAKHAHENGSYCKGPFVPVNCAAIPATLLESELFGHEKGAFTGATGRKPGMFELANEGTLFLDEIGDMPLELQPKLLRVLETGEFFRIGGRSPIVVKLLVVSATHSDLETRAQEGNFREDLFFRLNRFSVHSPPLRDRPEDILMLAEHFLSKATQRLGRESMTLKSDAFDALVNYPWPGNIRELQNVIERVAVVAQHNDVEAVDLLLAPGAGRSTAGLLKSSSLPVSNNSYPSVGSPPPSMDAVEEQAIREALRYTDGKKGEAAELLGIAWPTLRRKLKKYEIDADQP